MFSFRKPYRIGFVIEDDIPTRWNMENSDIRSSEKYLVFKYLIYYGEVDRVKYFNVFFSIVRFFTWIFKYIISLHKNTKGTEREPTEIRENVTWFMYHYYWRNNEIHLSRIWNINLLFTWRPTSLEILMRMTVKWCLFASGDQLELRWKIFSPSQNSRFSGKSEIWPAVVTQTEPGLKRW